MTEATSRPVPHRAVGLASPEGRQDLRICDRALAHVRPHVRSPARYGHHEPFVTQDRDCFARRASRDPELLLELRFAWHGTVRRKLARLDPAPEDRRQLDVHGHGGERIDLLQLARHATTTSGDTRLHPGKDGHGRA